jgi:hypothetical protein
MKKLLLTATALLALNVSAATAQETNLYWGDTHLHTNYSPDAFVQKNTTASPDDAYMFAKGAPVIDSASRAQIRIDTPLDFLVVTEHAEYTAVPKLLIEGDPRIANTPNGKRFIEMIKNGKGKEMFFELIGTVNRNEPYSDINNDEIRKTIWSDIVDAAERHNEPGKFTSFIGWEWSSIPNGQNLHRIVFTPQDGKVGKKFIPFSAFDSDVESEFWAWLDKTSKETGADFVAIPHNSNISNGLMFPLQDRAGNPISAAYANTRMKWEPVVEMTQIKGDSETHPKLSPNDEFADFETYEHLIKSDDSDVSHEDNGETRKGSYARSGLLRGMELEQKIGVNPYKFGMMGATDSHSGYSTAEEDNFWGKFSKDSTPESKDQELVPGVIGWDMSASGLAAVWAEENTRAAITEAFKRKEVYGTSGPRIGLRFFGGWDYQNSDANEKELATVGYAKGVPMGSDLTKAPKGKAPSFLVHAVKDPKDANLDRIQIVKGWVDAKGQSHEKVFDVALSDGRTDGNAPVGNSVDLKTGNYTNDIGDAQLTAYWQDPEFKAGERAFYYVRVLQIPTPRHSTYASIAMGKDPKELGKALTIQERAYSSPIWYTP